MVVRRWGDGAVRNWEVDGIKALLKFLWEDLNLSFVMCHQLLFSCLNIHLDLYVVLMLSVENHRGKNPVGKKYPRLPIIEGD